MRNPKLMEYLDELIEEKTKEPEFVNVCPCCGKPLIIKKHGIYYTVEEVDEIDFDEDNS